MKKSDVVALAAGALLLSALPVMAATDPEIEALRQEIEAVRRAYEVRIADLEIKLADLQNRVVRSEQALASPVNSPASSSNDNAFNPAIGLLLNGRYASYSEDQSGFAGFAPGEEGERRAEGLAIGESELNFAANVDDKFFGSLTTAIVRENGEDRIELEEAFVKTLPGAGLPFGATLKAGRALWTLGYLNEHHTHADDFADRPLPYRVFLNNAFNDDGLEFSYVLPTDLYTEIGGGLFRGDDFPFGGSDGKGAGGWSAYARIGGDIGDNQSWRLGGYVLSGEAGGGRLTHENQITFTGDTDLYAADLRYTWAPTGNPSEQELTFQGEYFRRNQNGSYEDEEAGTGAVGFDEQDNGWYVQGVYKFLPRWRLGLRYSQLAGPSVPGGLIGSALDSAGHDPEAYAVMTDWANSEFSQLRLQLNHEKLGVGRDDNQVILQYIMSLGAHGAHNY